MEKNSAKNYVIFVTGITGGTRGEKMTNIMYVPGQIRFDVLANAVARHISA